MKTNDFFIDRVRHPEQSPTTKTCRDCGVEKPREDFTRCLKYADGREDRCKKCRNRRNNAKAVEKRAEAKRMAEFGLI